MSFFKLHLLNILFLIYIMISLYIMLKGLIAEKGRFLHIQGGFGAFFRLILSIILFPATLLLIPIIYILIHISVFQRLGGWLLYILGGLFLMQCLWYTKRRSEIAWGIPFNVSRKLEWAWNGVGDWLA